MSEFHFTVVPYDTCVDEVIAFRNANRVLARDRHYFEWRYQHRPCQQSAMIVWGIDSHGRKVAAASIIPHDFYVLDGVYPVGMLGDISVAPECRGHGIATKLLQFLQQESTFQSLRACIVLPNDEAARPLERAGWVSVTSIARFVKIIDLGPRLQHWFGRWRPVMVAAHAINFLSRFVSMDGWGRHRASYQSTEISEFDQDFDELWCEIPKHGRIMALRNRDYLSWRYREHPTVDYRIFTIRQAQRLRGYIVFHVDAEVAVIDDFLVAEVAAGAWMIKEFSDHVRRARLASDIHVRYNADSFLALPWARFGFVRRPDTQRFMVSEPKADRHPSLPFDGIHSFVTAGDKDV
jgi:GNAT superfamily N-acetyltransferase